MECELIVIAERPGVAYGWKGWEGIGVIFGSCRAGKGYPDSVSATVSIPHLVDGPKLVSTAVISDEGPVTGANSIFGRAISGSGLGATPTLSEWISARVLILDRLSCTGL